MAKTRQATGKKKGVPREKLVPPQRESWRSILLTTAIVGVGIAVLFALGSCRLDDEAVGFDAWMESHKPTCERCRLSMDEMDGAICKEAFAKMQESLRTQTASRAISEPEAMPLPPLPPMVPVAPVSIVSPPQPPQPITIPPPLGAACRFDMENPAETPEAKTTERPGCEGGACSTPSLRRFFGRRWR